MREYFIAGALILLCISGCTTALSGASKVSDEAGLALDVYMSVGKTIQKRVCCGDLLTVQRARQLREAEGWYMTHDCERAKTEGGLVCE